mgnify:CR=1 FL=1
MRKIVSLALCMTLGLSLCSCGNNSGTSTTPDIPANSETEVAETSTESSARDVAQPSTESTSESNESLMPQVDTSDLPTDIDNIEDVSISQISPEDINWETVVYSVRDNDGYELEIEIVQSPWILVSNTELINAAWQDVANNNTLPQFDDWGFRQVNGQYSKELNYYNGVHQTSGFNISDMYYSVGTVTIKNKTEGWDIGPSNARNLNFYYGYCETIVENIPSFIGRVFYSDGASDYAYCININSSMRANTLGPITFVMMTPEYYSPANPNGMTDLILNDGFTLSYYTGNYSVRLTSENQHVKLGIQTTE